MKTIRVYLSVMALVFAFGGALASQLLVSAQTGYEFIDEPGTENDRCESKGLVCDTAGTVACTIESGPVLRSHDDETQTPACGPELTKLSR